MRRSGSSLAARLSSREQSARAAPARRATLAASTRCARLERARASTPTACRSRSRSWSRRLASEIASAEVRSASVASARKDSAAASSRWIASTFALSSARARRQPPRVGRGRPCRRSRARCHAATSRAATIAVRRRERGVVRRKEGCTSWRGRARGVANPPRSAARPGARPRLAGAACAIILPFARTPTAGIHVLHSEQLDADPRDVPVRARCWCGRWCSGASRR